MASVGTQGIEGTVFQLTSHGVDLLRLLSVFLQVIYGQNRQQTCPNISQQQVFAFTSLFFPPPLTLLPPP